MQIKANFKKELLAFRRTKTLLVLTCVFIGLAVFNPLMLKGLDVIVTVANEAIEITVEQPQDNEIDPDVAVLSALPPFTHASRGVESIISDLPTIGLIVFLLMINRFAGGEQKRRSIIIPRSSGLRPLGYLLPKFVVYPLAVLALSVAAVFAAAMVSIPLTEVNDLVYSRVLLSGILLGVYLMMYVCFHLTIGTATGKAGMSAAICIAVSIILPGIFAALSVGTDGDFIAYNPFALSTMAILSVREVPDTTELMVTAAAAFAIMLAVYFVALFAQNAKRIDNSGNEKLI